MFIPLSPNMTPGTRFVDVVFVLFYSLLLYIKSQGAAFGFASHSH